ncbi:MAG: sulfurtransferase TusA family protein [bacterium]
MFQLPKEVKNSIENYKRSLEEAQEGKISSSRFKGVRVPWGIYSHRGGKVYMARIRIPAGVVGPSQLKALAHASEEFGDGVLHITTRQDIQIHNVKIEDTIKVMEYLKEYNLSPRGGGGNTVRNVIACPLSGVCKEELFDVRKYAIAITEYLLRQDTSFNLPRKFKISFSGCAKDCGGCLLNDLGFLAKHQGGKEGFKVFVGGGMGANSRIGKLLEEFIPQEDLGYCVAAVKNTFYKMGDRRNKHHNRLRFLIEDMGLEEFKNFYRKEFQELKEKEYIVLRKIDFLRKEETDERIPRIDDEEYNEFLKYNVSFQKQKRFLNVELRIPRGDISAKRLVALANLEKDFPGIEFRTSRNQNLFICWMRSGDLYRLFLRLKEILDDFLHPQTLLDVVVCKGALTCNLGLCNSPGLAKEIEDLVREEFLDKKVFRTLEMKLNGCPNSCGQHPIGKLSFYGMVKRVDNRPVPFYKFLLGGRKEAELTRLAKKVGIIPARNIPNFLRDFLKRVDDRMDESEDIYDFLEGSAKEIAQKVLENYSYVPSYRENRDFYIDWGKTEEFSLAGLGPGECGAGVLDMIEADLTEARLALERAEKEFFSPADMKKALFFSARALLVVKGKDPKNEGEAFSDFKEKFMDEGVVSHTYSNVKEVFESIDEKSSLEERREKFSYARKFLEHIHELYKSMDSAFNFPKQEKSAKREEVPTKVLDLKGTPCPINYVKTKLVLENLNPGDTLEVLLDEGEPIDNVPKSLESDGHQIVKIEKQDRFYRVVVKKK